MGKSSRAWERAVRGLFSRPAHGTRPRHLSFTRLDSIAWVVATHYLMPMDTFVWRGSKWSHPEPCVVLLHGSCCPEPACRPDRGAAPCYTQAGCCGLGHSFAAYLQCPRRLVVLRCCSLDLLVRASTCGLYLQFVADSWTSNHKKFSTHTLSSWVNLAFRLIFPRFPGILPIIFIVGKSCLWLLSFPTFWTF